MLVSFCLFNNKEFHVHTIIISSSSRCPSCLWYFTSIFASPLTTLSACSPGRCLRTSGYVRAFYSPFRWIFSNVFSISRNFSQYILAQLRLLLCLLYLDLVLGLFLGHFPSRKIGKIVIRLSGRADCRFMTFDGPCNCSELYKFASWLILFHLMSIFQHTLAIISHFCWHFF